MYLITSSDISVQYILLSDILILKTIYNSVKMKMIHFLLPYSAWGFYISYFSHLNLEISTLKAILLNPVCLLLDYFSFLINLRYSLCKILSICDNLAHPSHSFTYSRHTQGHMWVPNQLWRSAALPEGFIWSAGCLGAFQSWKSSSSSHGSTWEGLKVRGQTDEQP